MLIGTRRHPKAPSLRRAKRIEKDLSGTKVSFVAPVSYSPLTIRQAGGEEAEFDLSNAECFKPELAADQTEIPDVRTATIFTGSWAFRGLPFVHGYCGSVNCHFGVKRVENLPVNESLFDSRVLAREVNKCLELTVVNDFHEPVLDDPFDITVYQWPGYLSPINCQWLSIETIDWLYLENQPLTRVMSSNTWSTAISDRHYMTCSFYIKRSTLNAGNPYRIEQRVSSDNFLAFMHKIMGSFKIELSPSAQAEKERVKLQIIQQSRPILLCTTEQVELSKQVLHHYSNRGYRGSSKDPNETHRADPKDVSAFIEERIKPRPLPGSYAKGPALNEK